MSKKAQKKSDEAALAMDWSNKLVAGAWLKKTRRSKQKQAKVTRKQTDNRYFAIVNERGDLYLTWGKGEDAKKMMDAEQRYEVSSIIVQCVDGDADGDASNGIQQAFNLVLPKNTPVTAASKAAKLAKKEQKAAKKKAKKDGGEPDPEPEPQAAEEGTPPQPGGEGEDAGEAAGEAAVEINPMGDDPQGVQQYKFVARLLAAGAKIEGGPDPSTSEGAHTLKILQDADRTNLEYTLDANNCLKDFRGTLLKAKGITIGLKLAVINEVDVLGWPAWMIDLLVQDEDTQWPMTVGFRACDQTILMDTDDGEQHATGKVVVVTGASKGLGKQVATTLAEEGANVAMLARNAADLEAARLEVIGEVFGGVPQMEFQDPPRNIIGIACDVTDQEAVDKAIDAVIAEFGEQIDVLVNCAGEGTPFEPKVSTTVDDFMADMDSHMRCNVQSFICPVKAVLEKAMVKAQDGQVISLSCTMGRDSVGIHSHADPMSFGFGYSKFALETLSHAYAHEYEDQRIRFNILVPGRVYSDGFPHRMGDLGHEYDPDHIRKGLLCMLDTDMNAEVVEAVAEAERANAGDGD